MENNTPVLLCRQVTYQFCSKGHICNNRCEGFDLYSMRNGFNASFVPYTLPTNSSPMLFDRRRYVKINLTNPSTLITRYPCSSKCIKRTVVWIGFFFFLLFSGIIMHFKSVYSMTLHYKSTGCKNVDAKTNFSRVQFNVCFFLFCFVLFCFVKFDVCLLFVIGSIVVVVQELLQLHLLD